ncbi:MAG: 50S ribosomal protein L13 [Nanoarchaeota archaeon]|nr:50S ribosomal protein L13 [Nanoarchaeota archaeon]
MIINAENLILGRIASFAAKKALLGETIDIVNCEKAVITGNKKFIVEKMHNKWKKGIPLKGPYVQRISNLYVRRVIRGMLPYKQHKGTVAFKRVKCYISVPDVLKDQKMITIQEANVSKLKEMKYVTVGEVMHLIGGK